MPQSERTPEELAPKTPACVSQTSRWKHLGKRLALLAGTLSLLILTLEAGARLLTDTTPPLLQRDPVVGQRFIRSFEGMAFDGEARREVLLHFKPGRTARPGPTFGEAAGSPSRCIDRRFDDCRGRRGRRRNHRKGNWSVCSTNRPAVLVGR